VIVKWVHPGNIAVVTRTIIEAAEREPVDGLQAQLDYALRLVCWLAHGVDPTTSSARNQSHGTALHHAVWSGSLDAVRVLVEAGADLQKRDTVYGGTPLGWATYGAQQQPQAGRAKQYAAIAAYLRDKGGTPSLGRREIYTIEG
jgi:hypothetical protein